jgi:hypothetical protein
MASKNKCVECVGSCAPCLARATRDYVSQNGVPQDIFVNLLTPCTVTVIHQTNNYSAAAELQMERRKHLKSKDLHRSLVG